MPRENTRTELYNLWYVNGVRLIPVYVFLNFNVTLLAFWAMRAGSSRSNQFRLDCGIYSVAVLLANTITASFGLPTHVLNNRGTIVITGHDEVVKLLCPHFHPSPYYRFVKSTK